MLLPGARGPLSRWLVAALAASPRRLPTPPAPAPGVDALRDDDLQLALWVAYELHYQGFDDVDDGWEWDTTLLGWRAHLEAPVRAALARAVAVPDVDPAGVALALQQMTTAGGGRSLSRYVHHRASISQFRELVRHRSIYHLKEADPHTFAIPRLRGPAKAAMVEIQADEYGGGRFERMHSRLFADLMIGVGLDSRYGHYLDAVPGITLATNNVMSMFGLHRRWRGAAVGQLAAIEMTSSLPNRRYGQGLRRLGGDDVACRFYDEHVEADAVHEQIAAHDLAGELARDQPALARDILFGAGAGLYVDQLFADFVLDRWEVGGGSLRSSTVAAA